MKRRAITAHEKLQREVKRALPDITKVIRLYGLRTVRYIVNQRAAQEATRREIEAAKCEAQERIAALERKLK